MLLPYCISPTYRIPFLPFYLFLMFITYLFIYLSPYLRPRNFLCGFLQSHTCCDSVHFHPLPFESILHNTARLIILK